ncbi:unnamed protein product [Callosobruchus maculatus]|uniref:Uncharacterized protein n=1 Tax=Callosobruchus maculatus TaxID=64391 RepID=A0A653DG46_CALMS|nr:unnamed protein product [Callosobruchus maculatus]
MAEILCLNKTKILEISEPKLKTDVETEAGTVTDSLREMVLDEPENYGSRSVSPIFDVQPFQIPSFVSHSKSCICVFCSCLQYQILVLEKARCFDTHQTRKLLCCYGYFSKCFAVL